MKLTLKALRVLYGMTQKEVAEKIGVSVDTWSSYENANTFPNTKILNKIQEIFGISYNDLVFSRYIRLNRENEIKNHKTKP
ncbi:helix-turn-helix transcriptional regulator [Ligilactobacillus sp. WILCCON 0076]|uniref:Helix-turn-helix transcriptional regulator n=1 Tax=Ligilactobacillus ubinensis TaxID=2876789 RepID=A0A9X2FJY3_9LACO|nr:helix-turn-helix transcriptional regulator [Ligilactobacillus ubinensis]MCP0887006.1 helix-turn-helix transcriptional regulator [Ligilactobacillus ubinensis]